MKKLIISMFALAAVLVSCSKSAVVEVPYENIPISFSSYNGKTPTVKSTSFVGLDSLGKYGFQVYGYLKNAADATPSYTAGSEYMDKHVKGESTGEGENKTWNWTYPGVSYWPGTMYLDFVAYGLNAGNVLTRAADQTNSNILDVTIPENVAEQKDVLVAVPQASVQYGEEKDGGNGGVVGLNFKHLLSRVSFALVTKANNPVLVTMENIELVGKFNTAGTINLALTKNIGTEETPIEVPFITPTATNEETTYDYLGGGTFTSTGSTDGTDIFNNGMLWTKEGTETTDNKNDDVYTAKTEPTDAETAQSAFNEANRYMMIMPTDGGENGHNAKLNITYFLPSAGSYDVEDIDLSSINFEAGKSYLFKLKVSTNAISFSVTVTDWATGVVTDEIPLN